MQVKAMLPRLLTSLGHSSFRAMLGHHNGIAEDLGSVILASLSGRQIRAEKQGPIVKHGGPRAFPPDVGEASLR